jgi:hypothetical protein
MSATGLLGAPAPTDPTPTAGTTTSSSSSESSDHHLTKRRHLASQARAGLNLTIAAMPQA